MIGEYKLTAPTNTRNYEMKRITRQVIIRCFKEQPDDGKREALGPLSWEDDRGGVVDWNNENNEFAVSPIPHLSEIFHWFVLL